MKTKTRLFFDSGFFFLLPGLLGFFIFFIFPFCLSLMYAFMDTPIGGSFAGFANFRNLFQNRAYLRGLVNTIRFIGVSVPLNLGVSLGLALIINRITKRREWFSLMFLIPLVIPSGSMVFFWKTLFSYDGALNGFLHRIGIEKINWLDSSIAMPVMILIFLWKNCGYIMAVFFAGLKSIPKEYYEAAHIDNASSAQVFAYITVPCIMPIGVVSLIMSVINSFKIFREIYLITGNYPHESMYTLQHFMNNMFISLQYPRLTSAATVLVLIIALFTQILLRAERKISL